MTVHVKRKGTAFWSTKQLLPLAQLRSFSFILSPSHPLRNIKSSSQLSSSPFSFLNLFSFLTSFLCNYYQQSESFFFFFVTMERTIFSSRKGGGEEGEGRTTYENWELASCLFNNIQLNLFTIIHKTTGTQWVANLAQGYEWISRLSDKVLGRGRGRGRQTLDAETGN